MRLYTEATIRCRLKMDRARANLRQQINALPYFHDKAHIADWHESCSRTGEAFVGEDNGSTPSTEDELCHQHGW
jgi:hypothetical protein